MIRRISVTVLLCALTAVLVGAATSSAQGVSTQTIASYLTRMGLAFRRSERDANLLIHEKTSGLRRAGKIELYIRNEPNDEEIQILAYPQVSGAYVALARVRDQSGLAREMLRRNEGAFGAYFLDGDGDLGFKYVFTTESGLGYDAFRTVVNELLRIADDPMLSLVERFR